MKNYGRNRLPKAPERRRVPRLERPRTSSLDRTRGIVRQHEERERPFDPGQRGSWRGRPGELVINSSRPQLQPGYAYAVEPEFDDDLGVLVEGRRLDDVSNDDWDTVVISEGDLEGAVFVGYVVIDGTQCAAFAKTMAPYDFVAQVRSMTGNMKRNGAVSEKELEDFMQGYLVTMLWSSTDESDESGGNPLDDNYSVSDISDESFVQARAACESFLSKYGEVIERAELSRNSDGSKMFSAGHDFWLTRNGHGAGFWDGDWSEPEATVLTKGCKEFGEAHPYVGDDGKVYIDDPSARRMTPNAAAGDYVPHHLHAVDFRYHDAPTENGEYVQYGNFQNGEANEGEPQWYEVEHAGGSDYSGGSLTKANYNELKKMLEEAHSEGPAVWADAHGGHGTYAILVVWDRLDESIQETLNALEDYPAISDEAMSEEENEREQEAWSNWAQRDFEKAFLSSLNAQVQADDPEYEVDDWPDDLDSETLFRLAMDSSNTYWSHESGDSVYVDLKRVVDGKGGAIDIVLYDKALPYASADDVAYLKDLDEAFGLRSK